MISSLALNEHQFLDDDKVYYRFVDRPIPESAKLTNRSSSPGASGRFEYRRTQVHINGCGLSFNHASFRAVTLVYWRVPLCLVQALITAYPVVLREEGEEGAVPRQVLVPLSPLSWRTALNLLHNLDLRP